MIYKLLETEKQRYISEKGHQPTIVYMSKETLSCIILELKLGTNTDIELLNIELSQMKIIIKDSLRSNEFNFSHIWKTEGLREVVFV